MSLVTPEVNPDMCTGCADCVVLCPGHAVELIDGKATIARPDNCNYCADCESFCPSGAIRCPFEIVLELKQTRSLE